MKALAIRTAMCGGGLSYSLYVPVKEIPTYDGTRYTTIGWKGHDYLDYLDATIPEEHFAMPKGWERYENLQNHRKHYGITALEILKQSYPELRNVKGELSQLWYTGLPIDKEVHAEKWVDI